MMRKNFKYAYVFSLWLAGLFLCAHLIIPHDHHIADTFSYQEKNCPASDDKSGHHSGFPIHCHAFNDLASEKFRPYNFSHNIQYNSITIHRFSDAFTFELQISCVNIIDLQKPVLDSYALELSLLRAPPALA